MIQDSTEISNHVTVLVFKDNYAARTFKIPLKWISKLGLLVGFLVSLTVISVFMACKYYKIASIADPSKIQDLEQELLELRTSIKKPTPAASANNSLFFSGFPALSPVLPDPSTLPFSIISHTITWRDKMLQVQFSLQYTKEDQGNQQGKILILARGPNYLLSYPPATLNRAGTPHLISLENAEPFSVTRVRHVKAVFGPIATHKDLQEIEIFIFDNLGQILKYQKFETPSMTPPPEKEDAA